MKTNSLESTAKGSADVSDAVVVAAVVVVETAAAAVVAASFAMVPLAVAAQYAILRKLQEQGSQTSSTLSFVAAVVVLVGSGLSVTRRARLEHQIKYYLH